MPVVFGTAASAVQGLGTAVSSPIAASITINAGDLVIVEIDDTEGTALSVSSITGGGTYASKVSKTHAGVGTQRTQTWWAIATSGASSVSVAFTGAPSAVILKVSKYTGASGLGPNTNTADSGAGSSANPSISLTTTQLNSYVAASFAKWTNNVYVANVGTIRVQNGGTGASDFRGAFVDNTSASIASVTCSTTVASEEWAATIIEILEAAGSAVAPWAATRGLPFQGPRDALGFLKARVWDYTITATAAPDLIGASALTLGMSSGQSAGGGSQRTQ